MTARRGPSTGRPLAPLLILLLLVLLGFALRAHNLDAFSFWTDEGLTPERSGYPIGQILRNEIVIQGFVTKDTHPPLYYLIIHLTRQLFGASDFAFRYPSVLFGTLFIPLLYQLGRRMSGVTLGLIAALLATVNPLQVYYSQEARMYALLVLLVTAMSYVLWRAMQTTDHRRQTTGARTPARAFLARQSPALADERLVTHHSSRGPSSVVRSLLLYALLAALALYTHYTVAFLIAAQALFWAWLLWRAGLKWLIIGGVGLAVVAAIPLIPYTIPRLLAGAEANYYYVSPLTMLVDVVRFFNLGLTVDFAQTFVIALNLLAFGLMGLGLWAAGTTDHEPQITDLQPASSVVPQWMTRLFLLSWLLAVVLGLMAGSILFKPMYQGVRHIMAGSPAFLLLVAFGIWAIWSWLPATREPAVDEDELTGWAAWRAARPNVNPLALIPLSLLLIGSVFALVNLFTNPAYVKDDFRAIVRFIETSAGDRDVIVYNNAVLLPLHEHYRQRDDIAVTALPAYPQMASGQEPELAALARDYERVWLITDPPADGRDDDKLIQSWFDANLTETINRLFPARTTEARVIGYSTRTGVTADARPPLSGVRDWGGSLQLGGVSVRGPNPLSLPTLWVDLFWQADEPPVGEQLLFSLVGPDGEEAYRHAHALLRNAGRSWKATGLNRLSYDLPLPPGLPPGFYTLSVALDDGDLLPLVPVEIASTDTWPVSPEGLFGDSELQAMAGKRPAIDFPNGLALAAAVPWDDTVLPGNNLPVTLYWRVGPDGADLSDVHYRLEVIDSRGNVLRSQEDKPGASWLGPVDGGALIREDTGLYIRPDTEPGRYRLRWTLLDGDTPLGEPVVHGRIRIEAWPLETEVPPAAYVVKAGFGPAIQLHSYDMGVPTGGLLDVTFYWQALAEPESDAMVFVHLVNGAGEIVSQVDAVPAGGTRPASGWRAGEVITDSHRLPIPGDLPPGEYRVYAGLYEPGSGARPPVTLDGAPQPDNRVLLATLQLPEDTP